MPGKQTSIQDVLGQREMALSRWDTEGGAGPEGAQEGPAEGIAMSDLPQPTSTELTQLHVRVIALENLVITLLAGASERQLRLARDMATQISPKPGFTRHPLTVHAAAHIISSVERAGQLRLGTFRRKRI